MRPGTREERRLHFRCKAINVGLIARAEWNDEAARIERGGGGEACLRLAVPVDLEQNRRFAGIECEIACRRAFGVLLEGLGVAQHAGRREVRDSAPQRGSRHAVDLPAGRGFAQQVSDRFQFAAAWVGGHQIMVAVMVLRGVSRALNLRVSELFQNVLGEDSAISDAGAPVESGQFGGCGISRDSRRAVS